MGNPLHKFKPSPPRNKPKRLSQASYTRSGAIATANKLQAEGWRTMVEGGLYDRERHHAFIIWYWKKPKQRRAA